MAVYCIYIYLNIPVRLKTSHEKEINCNQSHQRQIDALHSQKDQQEQTETKNN